MRDKDTLHLLKSLIAIHGSVNLETGHESELGDHVRISYMSNNEEKIFYDSNLEGVIDKASRDSAKTYFQYAKILMAKIKGYDMWIEADINDIVFDGSITKKKDKIVFDEDSVKKAPPILPKVASITKNPSSRRKKGKKRIK